MLDDAEFDALINLLATAGELGDILESLADDEPFPIRES